MESKTRCFWCSNHPLYIQYHDEEWGKPVYDDAKLFEMLLLESFQAGLSWFTILVKRENFKQAFSNFDVQAIAKYGDDKIAELLQNDGIIKNKLKIKASITNALAFIAIQKEFGSFSKYLWSFTNNQIVNNSHITKQHFYVTTPISDAISKDLKKRGFKFLGSTTVYAYMQAIGMVNDHTEDCFVRTASK
ncbi:DNA-3-methyladenine glycosylase I [Flavobacterium agricola]|uniref:DNA-3-methyladenine glycosylase I n=1 Tax=Flavobacterium agricola TaxID=2870839 RepID=A0ABY6LX04_9FLAO|nr:DNA-3-methyladenine glycosylase I [Flavobacterium agricola]UYW00806.1 DNA-3-methyladenine glycosylase I [Flavobacterium agricola]